MRKKYKLIEEESPKSEFKIINVSQNKKDVIFADGTSLSDTYFSGKGGIDEVRDVSTINGVKYYEAFNRTLNRGILFSDKNGGDVFEYPITLVRCFNNLFLVKRVKGNLEALIDSDFNIVIDWSDYISYAFGDLFIVSDRGENIFDVSTRKYLFDHYFLDAVDYLSGLKLFKVEKEGEYNLVNEKGELIFKTNSGTPIWVSSIETFDLEFERDSLSDSEEHLDCLIVSDSEGYDSLYIVKNNVPEKVEIVYGGSILGEGSYKILQDEPRDGALMISTTLGHKYNYINKEGKVQYDKWFSSIDNDSLEDVNCMIIKRDNKFNIVSLKSMIPLCDDDDWFDGLEYIEDPYNVYNVRPFNNMLAVSKNGKCNLLDVADNGYVDITKPLLDTPCDDIMIYEDDDTHEKHIICMYDGVPYLYLGHKLFRCKEIHEGRNGLVFIKDIDDKWNFVFVDHDNRFEEPKLELDDKDKATNIYDINLMYPIIEKEGKFTYIDTEGQKIAFTTYDLVPNYKTNKYEKKNETIRWFDDVESFDENNESKSLEFRVKENGKWKTIDDIGNVVDENEDDK